MKNYPKVYLPTEFHCAKKELAKGNPKVTVDISFKYPKIEDLVNHSYKKRLKIVRKELSKKYKKTCQLIAKMKGKVEDVKSNPFSVKASISYLDINKVLEVEGLESIWIKEIEGIKRKKSKNKHEFYTVVSKVRIEIEGFNKKKGDVELRITLMKAKSKAQAEKKTKRDYKNYEKPYLNVEGRLVSWKFVKIVDVYETGLSKSSSFNDAKGVELYSKFISPKNLKKIFG